MVPSNKISQMEPCRHGSRRKNRTKGNEPQFAAASSLRRWLGRGAVLCLLELLRCDSRMDILPACRGAVLCFLELLRCDSRMDIPPACSWGPAVELSLHSSLQSELQAQIHSPPSFSEPLSLIRIALSGFDYACVVVWIWTPKVRVWGN